MSEDVVEYARQHNLLSNPHWAKVRDIALQPADDFVADSIPDFEDEFTSVEFDPLTHTRAEIDEFVSNRYKRLVGLNGETC